MHMKSPERLKITTKEFKKIIGDSIKRIAESQSWDVNQATYRGYAFQRWIAEVITNYDQGIDTDPDDALLYSKDLKADIVLEDETRKHLVIAQCKYVSLQKTSPVEEAEVNDFFSRHDLYMNKKWIEKHGSAQAQDALRDYAEKVNGGYSVNFYFVSTGSATDRVKDLADVKTATFASANSAGIHCTLLDFEDLKDYFVRSQTLEASVPKLVSMDLPKGSFMVKREPHDTVVAIVKSNFLRNLYREHKESLFNWNIRGYLGDRSINQEIKSTLEEQPEDFFYYNNGVSAICTDLKLEGNHLEAQNFQIINGAQTVGTIGKTSPSQEAEVLFRVTRTQSVKTDKGINANIIRFNNTQNAIKVSDFRANDAIQTWLGRSFSEQGNKGALPNIGYQPKRGGKRTKPGTRGLRLEELAKIRYSYFHEPTLVHSSPKDLWTPRSDGGKYHLAFGVGGELLDVWSREEFERTLTAIALAFHIEDAVKKDAKENPDLKFLVRLRFHMLALGGLYVRGQQEWMKQESTVAMGARFKDLWSAFWPEARRVLIDLWSEADERKVTMFSFVRGTDRWSQIRRRFALHTNSNLEQTDQV